MTGEPRPLRRALAGPRPRRLPLAFALTLAGCSTLATEPEPRACKSNDECDTAAGEVCALDQGFCYPGTDVPPLRHIGLDIREPALAAGVPYGFRAEVRGCDREAVLVSTDDRSLEIRKLDLLQTFRFALGDPPPMGTSPPEGSVGLTQASRLGLRPLTATLNTIGPEDTPVEPQIEWPHYHPDDEQPDAYRSGGFAVVEVVPDTGRAMAYRMVSSPVTQTDSLCETDEDCCKTSACNPKVPNVCIDHGPPFSPECSWGGGTEWTFGLTVESPCDRRLTGAVFQLDADGLPTLPLADATLTLQHHDPAPPAPRLGAPLAATPPPELTCASDDDCVTGDQFCEIPSGASDGTCVLALAGRSALKSALTTEPDGTFAARTYTYCEGVNLSPLDRTFRVTVSPGAERPAPSVSFQADVTFEPAMGGVTPDAAIDGLLCVPEWGPPDTVRAELSGDPVELWEGADGSPLTCCDISCLASAAEADFVPPQVPETCTGGSSSGPARVQVQAPFQAPDPTAWEAAGCAPLWIDDEGRAGALRRELQCGEDGTCMAGGMPSPGSGPATYTVRVETPPGSVLGSQILTGVPLPAPGEALPLDLPRRVLVRGEVTLGPNVCTPSDESACDDVDAVVIAERLAMPGEDPDVTPGPYYHTTNTFTDPTTGRKGAYLLPLDRGVWLVTVLPAFGARGDPAPIRILDLREGGDRTQNFVLPLGIRVTVQLRGFDRRTGVTPYDLGSWASLDHPGREGTVQLDRPGECLTTDPSRACRIHALTPGGTPLLPSVTSTVQVTARSISAGASCPS